MCRARHKGKRSAALKRFGFGTGRNYTLSPFPSSPHLKKVKRRSRSFISAADFNATTTTGRNKETRKLLQRRLIKIKDLENVLV